MHSTRVVMPRRHPSVSLSPLLKPLHNFSISDYFAPPPTPIPVPLVACVIIQFSFQHGICLESTVAFATFGMLKIFLAGDYSGGLYWANAVREMESKIRSMNKSETNAESTCRLILVRIAPEINANFCSISLTYTSLPPFPACCC